MRTFFIMIIPFLSLGILTFIAFISEIIKSIWVWSVTDFTNNVSGRCDDIAEGIRCIFKGITNIDLHDN